VLWPLIPENLAELQSHNFVGKTEENALIQKTLKESNALRVEGNSKLFRVKTHSLF
jgi:hypothetical protein